jgi:hypothetical protein
MVFLRNLLVYSDTQYTRRFLPTRRTGQVRFIIIIFYGKSVRNDAALSKMFMAVQSPFEG